ncbi:magnesium-translocating P-type ATPase [Polytolypa hystricis UAMH7299]|uniref:Magnesium-transporting ATPase, P-type 1 n=1 Tax=Polytolypa hystricis (strain UAMH7299) TaxID=1447883 RepID=A0A2B7XDG5_POLH7|nr:magnesium-translocating P-type ATPase [Polytolypa hystricis UAMH7299]
MANLSRVPGRVELLCKTMVERVTPVLSNSSAGGADVGDAQTAWQHPPNPGDKSTQSVLRAFASLPASVVLGHLQSSLQGLAEAEANKRLNVAGPNLLTSTKPVPWWRLLLLILPNPFNILLAILAIVSVATPDPNWKTFTILMVMIVISCALRFWQEYRSGIAVIKLQSSVKMGVQVRRQHMSLEKPMGAAVPESKASIHQQELVPGDIVVIQPGLSIPADCLILESACLQISQSSLTGESEPLRKVPSLQFEKFEQEGDSLFDLENIAFMGTSVISGSGLGVVLRTGDDTFIATIMKELKKKRPINSFQRGIRNVTYMLIAFMVTMVPIVLVISGKSTGNWKDAALFSLSVAVGLVPEMLPAIVNANLARGAFLLSKKKAIVKRLDSIQNLGGMSILCSDKTGTLTKDEIALLNYIDCQGNRDSGVFQLAYINAVCQDGHSNNIDAATIKFKSPENNIGIPNYTKVTTIPFTFERRRSSCVIRGPTKKLKLICKGAFEEVSALCTRFRDCTSTLELDREKREWLAQTAHRFSSEGQRVILIASRELSEYQVDGDDIEGDLEHDLTAEGFLTLLDPLKEDAAASVQRLQDLRVDVRILTGDNLPVALNLCRALNLVTHVDEESIQAVTGSDLARLEGTEEFHNVVKSCKVFAKLTPSQKGQVVSSLKREAECVGMLGDGINDCIALRLADVGISVDSGAGVAKDCADVILTEKALDIVADSVTIGRVTYGNTIKYIKMVASSNFGNVFSILIASSWLPFQPMASLQILVQNLLYDFSQLAIPWDRMDEEYLLEPKQWNVRDLLRFIVVLGPTSSTIDMCTFCLGWFYYGIRSTDDPEAVKRFQTHWFMQGLLTQTMIVHLLRTAKIPVIQRRASRILVASTVAIMLIGFSIPYIPVLKTAVKLVRPENSFMGFMVVGLVVYCIEVQLVKMLYIRVFGTWL